LFRLILSNCLISRAYSSHLILVYIS
jgi:hypothetical protein